MRVAFALMLGLALCCAVMYVTADGQESIHSDEEFGDTTKVMSTDVAKTDVIWTDDTPDGHYKLVDYFKKVESEIAAEVAGRTADIAATGGTILKNPTGGSQRM